MAKPRVKVKPKASKASSANTSALSSKYNSRAPSPTPNDDETDLQGAMAGLKLGGKQAQAFRFFDLPAELRIRIYELVLHTDKIIDLDPLNHLRITPRLSLFLVSHRVHAEAYRVFYAQPIRLFPTHGRFHHTKAPLLARLPLHYRAALTTLELRLGPDWSAPPRCQNTLNNPALGLADCTNLRMLKIFVECDPSDSIFNGFRGRGATEDTYKFFALRLLQGIFRDVGGLETVEIDAFPGVKRDAPLILALKREVRNARKKLKWGELRGWEKEGDEPGLIGLEKEMAGMGLGGGDVGRVVEVGA